MSIRENLEAREHQLSKHATKSFNSTRAITEPKSEIRTEFQRDRDRIIHSNAFRRLKHKTQVFIAPKGDHYVTRLTHTLEVSQIGRTIARALNLNEDLVEAMTLGHDIGHTPFGHAGEEVLNEMVSDGFSHASQSIRLVEVLEKEGQGLNLTEETKEGILRGHTVDAKMRFLQIDDVSWDDVVLSPQQRKSLERNIVKFISHISLYESKNLPTSRGCLLTGPPGTGKTLTCSAVMNQVDSTIFYITSEDITDRGQISDLYDVARKVAPSIVVVEDIDTLGGIDRNRAGGDHPILGEFLNCLAGVESNSGVVTIATTNYPEYLDKALVDRPGRFDFRIDFGLPDEKLRKHILEKYLSTFNHKNIDLKPLVKATEGMTGAHLKEMVMMAYMDSLEASGYKKTTKITQKHLEQSMKTITENRAKYNHYKKERPQESILHG